MTKSVQKIALSTSRDIPFDKLVLAQSNVRHVKAGVGIEQLAEDIARRTLLQSLTVRAVVGDDGVETGIYEVPAGGRRFRALELLVKQKRLPKTAPIPCVIRETGLAEEDSLAENVQRAPLHPLDQFRAFLAMRERGMGEEEIAAAFFVTPAVVKQRLRLASVSPALLNVYAEDDMTLEQLMAFTVSSDHERQDAVWEAIQRSYSREPYAIRRMLTEGAVRASDKRAVFVGLEAYEEAGGTILRDLFQADDGGWLQDPGLLDMLVSERLREEAETVRAECWRWVDTAPDFAYGHTYGLRGIVGERHELTADDEVAREVLVTEYAEIEAAHAGGADLPDEVDARLGEIETALEVYDNRSAVYRPEDLAIAGAFVSIDGSGKLRVERGYVRPEDELHVVSLLDDGTGSGDGDKSAIAPNGDGDHNGVDPASSGGIGTGATEPEEDEGLEPLPDRLLTELTACRTVALREAIGRSPKVAFTAALHALCLKLFYHYAQDSCVELDIKSVSFGSGVPGLNDSVAATTIDARHREYAERLPREPGELWDALVGFGDDDRASLFAHCIGHGVNAVHEAYNRRPRALAHADRLAAAVDLDMAQAWTPTAENFIGRVTKARIVEAVREANGDAAAGRLTGMKKPDMVAAAEVQLDGTGWLPEPLRTPGRFIEKADGEPVVDESAAIEAGDTVSTDTVEETAAIDGEQAIDDIDAHDETDDVHLPAHALAAE
ncbi:ParB/RepB/Spo0J family partition protein [Sphingosinicellaceae bacterium]|nr:ParB/RepB/Spo0J family partition protein [Sphingosinicellaceae bacterium]